MTPSEGRDPAAGSLRSVVGLYLLAGVLICLFRLGANDVVSMEGIVADSALHMMRTHEYSVPHHHGELYTYKPPMAYWMALASFRVFGEESEWTLRLPFALSALLMGLAVLLVIGRFFHGRTGLLCAIASLTGVLCLPKLHLAEFDLPLAAGVGVAVAVACRNLAGRPSAGLWLLGYLALAFGFLVKGTPALIFYAPGLLLAALLTRRLATLWSPAHLAGVALFALIAGAWIAAAFSARGWAAFEQPLSEAADKGFTWTLAAVGATLVKPLIACVAFLPWTLLLAWPGAWSAASDPHQRMRDSAASFVVAGLLVFMLVSATEERYLLPLSVPVAILCGLAAERALSQGHGRLLLRGTEVLLLVLAVGALVSGFLESRVDVLARALLGLSAVAALGLVAHGWRRPSGRRFVMLVLMTAVLGWLSQIVLVDAHRARSRSLQSIALEFDRHVPEHASVWTAPVSKHFHHSSLFFYLRRPVRTFSADGDRPASGDCLVLFSDEHPELFAQLPFDARPLTTREQRGTVFLLAEARAGEGVDRQSGRGEPR